MQDGPNLHHEPSKVQPKRAARRWALCHIPTPKADTGQIGPWCDNSSRTKAMPRQASARAANRRKSAAGDHARQRAVAPGRLHTPAANVAIPLDSRPQVLYIIGTIKTADRYGGGPRRHVALIFWSGVRQTPIPYADRHEGTVSARQDGFCCGSGTLCVHRIIDRSSP